MGMRSLPFFKGKKGYQFAGGGITSDGGGGAIEPATTEKLGGVIVGGGLSVTSNGLLSFARTFGLEFDTGLKTHDNKTIYGVYYTFTVHMNNGENSVSIGEIAGRTSNIVDIFGYIEDREEHHRYKINDWGMTNGHSVALGFNAKWGSGDGDFHALLLYTKIN